MNTTDREIELDVDQASENLASEESKPECKNGVCELNWQPQKPQAA